MATAFRKASASLSDPAAAWHVALLEAESHLDDEEWRQAFFLAWTVVERRLNESWEGLLRKATGAQGTKSDAAWQTVQMAGGLEIAGWLPPATAAKIIAYNRKRNSILHGETSSQTDARKMLEIAKETVAALSEKA
ncbi:MAG: hypothetical protein V4510_10405 [bacterium]